MSLRTILATALCGTSLSACGLFPQHVSPPASIMTDVAERMQSNGYSSSGALTAADSITIAKEVNSDFIAAWNNCDGANGHTCTLSSVVSKGIVVIDYRCGKYFRALGRSAQDYAYSSKQLSLTGGTAGAIEGLTGVTAKAISLTGTLFGFGAASASAYQDTYVFSPDIASVENLVKSAQQQEKTAISSQLKDGAIKTRDDAAGVLEGYEKTCEVQTIRSLVNQSINVAKVALGPTAAPTITSNNTIQFPQGEPGAFTVTAQGNPPPTFSTTNCPNWITIDSSTGEMIAASPPASGPKPCTVIAQNGIPPASSQTLVITIVAAPSPGSPPVFASLPTASFIVGKAGQFQVKALGAAPLTYSGQCPSASWAKFDPNSQIISGTPTASDVKPPEECDVTVTDSNHLSAKQIIHLSVSPQQSPAMFSPMIVR